MRGRYLLIFAFFVFIITFLQEASAVGLGDYSGGLNYLIDFKPGLKETFSYFMVANAPGIMDYEVTATGSLAQYFTLSDTLFKDVWPGQVRSFTATLNMPQEKPAAGLHGAEICVTESQGLGGGGIIVRTRACSLIYIRVLYPEKYLKITDFTVPNADKGDILDFKVMVKSWTETEISSVKAVIGIFGPSEKGFDKKIATIQTDEKQLASNQEIELSASIDTREYESGLYNAVATVYYDGNTANASKQFKIGMLAVKVVNYTAEFLRNKINKFNVDIESRWNSVIENVYADIIIENETLKTPPLALQPWEKATLATYWDTANKKAQYYNGKITLHFAGNSTEQDIKVKVLVNPEEIKKLLINTSLTALIVILIIFIVITALRKPKENKYGGKKKKF